MLTFHVTRMEVGGQRVQHAVEKRGALQVTSHRDNSQLTTYVLAFMFRWNAKPHLLEALGSLAKKASR